MKQRIAAEQLVNGQVWQLGDSNLLIKLVGKRLVHYKHFKGKNHRAPISLSGKEVLEKYLKVKKGILVQA